MNINKLTLGQIKILQGLLAPKANTSGLGGSTVGTYVICRSRNEGINAGYVKEMDDTGVVLSDCRRLWHHKPSEKTACWYEGVTQYGLSEDSRVSVTVGSKVIIEDYSLTACEEIARQSIEAAVPHAQN